MKKILVLGGTQMLGRSFVQAILNSSDNYCYDLTLANRNITNPNIFHGINKIYVDRHNKLLCSNLSKSSWDIVVDFSCYNIEEFRNTYGFISCDKYIFISSIATLYPELTDSDNYNDPMVKYAKDKLSVEKYIESLNDGKITIYRPCTIYGANDYTGRFYEKNNKFYLTSNNYCVSDDTSGFYMSQEKLAIEIIKLLQE